MEACFFVASLQVGQIPKISLPGLERTNGIALTMVSLVFFSSFSLVFPLLKRFSLLHCSTGCPAWSAWYARSDSMMCKYLCVRSTHLELAFPDASLGFLVVNLLHAPRSRLCGLHLSTLTPRECIYVYIYMYIYIYVCI